LPALPEGQVLLVVDHRAAPRRDLGKPVRQHCSDQAHVGRKGGVDVLVENLGDGGQPSPPQCARSRLLTLRSPASQRLSSAWASARRRALMSSTFAGSTVNSTRSPSGLVAEGGE